LLHKEGSLHNVTLVDCYATIIDAFGKTSFKGTLGKQTYNGTQWSGTCL